MTNTKPIFAGALGALVSNKPIPQAGDVVEVAIRGAWCLAKVRDVDEGRRVVWVFLADPDLADAHHDRGGSYTAFFSDVRTPAT